MIKVRIPTPLRPLTKGQGEVESAAANIVDMIGSLDATYPGLKNRLCDEKGDLRRFVNIYVNDEDVRFTGGLDTIVGDVRRADVRETTGWMDLELTGETEEIERAIDGIRTKGCVVDPIELNVVE